MHKFGVHSSCFFLVEQLDDYGSSGCDPCAFGKEFLANNGLQKGALPARLVADNHYLGKLDEARRVIALA